FAAWSLTGQDALMIVAIAEREVYLEVKIGGVIDRAIMQSTELKGASNPHSLLLDYYFTPSAADGDFAQAITTVAKQIDVMKSELERNQGGAGEGSSNVGSPGVS